MPCVNIYNISEYLAKLLNTRAYTDILQNGIQIEGSRPISIIATAVTPSLYAIEQAQALNADLLVTHHGLFLKSGPYSLQGILCERVAQILASGMHLLSYHLPLDVHEKYGNAWPVARALGWDTLEGFYEYQGTKIGVRGRLKAATSTHDLFAFLRTYWNADGVCLGTEKLLTTVAFIPGSGHRAIHEALLQNIDCLITGTVDDSTWHTVHESSIVAMAFGHHATERLGIQLLGAHLADVFGLQHHFIDEQNPL